MVDISIVYLEEKKETPQEYSTRNLQKVRDLLHKYGWLLEPEKLSEFNKSFKVLSEKLMFEGFVNTQQVVELSREVGYEVTTARAKQIISKVEKDMENWQNSRHAEEFVKTDAYRQANKWLQGASSGKTKDVRSWIDAGWFIHKQVLDAPWGKCQCGKELLPKLIGKEDAKKWRVFVKCGDCYHQERSIEERQMLATLGEGKHRVKKPGSAAKRGQRN